MIRDDQASPLLERADAVLAGGSLNVLKLPEGRRLVVARGEGARLFDIDGEEYLDFLLGSGPMVIGHAHEEVVAAVRAQVERGSTYYALNPAAVELAERVVRASPCAELVRFCSTGSESTMLALRLARAASGRQAFLKFEGGFHGNSDGSTMSMTPREDREFPRPEPSSSGVPSALESEVLIAPFNDVELTEKLIEAHHRRLAAIIVEPIQRTIPPEPGFLESLRSLCSRYGIVLIFDEVVTGFRVARGGAQELYGVTPDLATYGKVLGGGYPLAAVAGKAEIMREVDRGAYLSGTHFGHPAAAVAGLATLDVLDRDDAYARLAELGARARAGLASVLADRGHHAHVLGVGPIFQVAFCEQRPRDYRGSRRSDPAAQASLCGFLLDHGVLCTVRRGYLSLAHRDADVDRLVELTDEWAARAPKS